MKLIVMRRESNDFSEVLADPVIKTKYKLKMEYTKHIILGFPSIEDDKNNIISYVLLKYGDEIIMNDDVVTDRTPTPGVDYYPVRKK